MKNFLDNYPILTIVVVLWAMALVTLVLLGVFFITPEVNAGLATVVTAVLGLPAVVFAFAKWRLGDDEDKAKLGSSSSRR